MPKVLVIPTTPGFILQDTSTDMKKELKDGIPAIVARLSEDFCGGRGRLALLFWCEYHDLMHQAGYYEDGEEIPMSAIADWQEVTI